VAIAFAAQRLEIGEVVLVSLPEQDEKVEATVVRDIDRTETTVRVTLRAGGLADSSRSGLSASGSPSFAGLDWRKTSSYRHP
jgi:hypothetical protein